jgi:hypothetical protein
MRALLELIDLYSWNVTFNFNKKTAYHTKLGFFLSILTLIASLLFLFYFSLDMITKTNPLIIFSETGFDIDTNVTINEFIKKIEFNGEFSTDEELKLNKTISPIDNKFFYYMVKLHNTDENEIFYFLLKDKISYELNSIIKTNLTTNISINTYTYKYHGISNIDNTISCMVKNGINCSKISDYIYNHGDLIIKLRRSTLITARLVKNNFLYNLNEKDDLNQPKIKLIKNNNLIHIKDNIINLKEKKKFSEINYSIEINLDFLTNDPYYSFIFFYNPVKLIDNIGIVFDENENYISYKKKTLYPVSKDIKLNYIYYDLFKIRLEPIMKQYIIKFKKLQNVFAEFGGFFNTFLLIGNIIIGVFRTLNFEYDLVNIIFGYDEEELNEYKNQELERQMNSGRNKKFSDELKFYEIRRKTALSSFVSKFTKKVSDKSNIGFLNNLTNKNNSNNLNDLNGLSDLNMENKGKFYLNGIEDINDINFNNYKNNNENKKEKENENENEVNNLNNLNNFNELLKLNSLNNKKEQFDNSNIDNRLKEEDLSHRKINIIKDINEINDYKDNNNEINSNISNNISKKDEINDEYFKEESKNDALNEVNKNKNNQIEVELKNFEEKIKNDKRRHDIKIEIGKNLSILDPNEIQIEKKLKDFQKFNSDKKKRIFRYSYYDLILIAFCRNCHKKKSIKDNQDIYIELSEKMVKNLDITSYYNLIENFHNLRAALFNENQNFSFDYLRNRDYKEVTKKELEKKLEKSYQYFYDKLKEDKLDQFDKFILKNVDKKYERFLYD